MSIFSFGQKPLAPYVPAFSEESLCSFDHAQTHAPAFKDVDEAGSAVPVRESAGCPLESRLREQTTLFLAHG